MDRINTASKAVDLFGVGKHGWKNRNVATGVEPTDFNAQWCNGVQEELLAVIEAAGLAPNAGVNTQLLQAIQLLLAAPGAVVYFARNTAPTGYLKANGALVSRATYAALFTAIGTTFGVGDGATTFALPDGRGEFFRGWDDGRGADSGRAFGSAQGDAIRNLTGAFGTYFEYINIGSSGVLGTSVYTNVPPAPGTVGTNLGQTMTANIDASRQVPTAAENRPRSIALLACIKY